MKLSSHIRWGSWGSEVLGRCGASGGPSADDLQQTILDRQKEADVEADDGKLIEEKICEKLKDQGYDTDCDRVFIPTRVMAPWINEATGERYRVAAAGRVLDQKISEGEIVSLTRSVTHQWGKGFVWNGEHADEGQVMLDIDTRINNTPQFR